MAEMSYSPAPMPVPVYVNVISSHFCVDYPVDLSISKKVMSLEGAFGVTDINGDVMFTVKGKLFSLHDRRVLIYSVGNLLITFQPKFTENKRSQIDIKTMSHPVVVIGPQFCLGYPVNLTIRRKLITLSGKYQVTDDEGNIIFKLRESGSFLSFHKSRILLDAAGNPIITLQNKIMSAHHRWRVFRGDSTDEKDMLFSVKKSSVVPLKTKFLVFLASNTREKVRDFKIKGKLSNDSCVVYAGKSKNVIARMKQNNTAQSFLLGRDSFGVSVSPHVDYAFVVSLVVILREIYEYRVQQLQGTGDVISAA